MVVVKRAVGDALYLSHISPAQAQAHGSSQPTNQCYIDCTHTRRGILTSSIAIQGTLEKSPGAMAESSSDDIILMSSSRAGGRGVLVSDSNLMNGTDHLLLPTSASAAGFGGQSVEEADLNRRNQQFRRLVSDIAEHLDKSDVDKIIWQKELPQKMKDKPALEVLQYLYKNGHFTMDELRPLTQLLKEIHRGDITEKVESYQEKFGE